MYIFKIAARMITGKKRFQSVKNFRLKLVKRDLSLIYHENNEIL